MGKAIKWRQTKKKLAVCLIVAVAGGGLISLGIYFWGGTQGDRVAAQEASIQEAQAQTGTISDTIVGTGNLQYEEGTSITIPSGIVVDEVKVEENEPVSKGDVLAVVNQVSVLRAMEDIQDELDELDEQIDESKEETDSQSITAKTEGTVKKIYVQEGQETADCMISQGALLLLSIDGGTDEEAKEEELAITAVSGTVEEICVSEGEEVYEGTTLLKITIDGQSLEYQEQMARRKELTQELQNLVALSKSGVITAESDGIVKSVNISAEGDGAEETEGAQGAQSTAAAVEKTETSGYISAVAGSAEIEKKAVALVGQAGISKQTDVVERSSQASGEDVQEPQNTVKEETPLTLKISGSGTSNQTVLAVETPKTGNKPQKVINAEDGSYQGQISWKPGEQKFAAETSYQAFVSLTAGEGYLFTDGSVAQAQEGVISGLSVAAEGKELSFCITYPFTASEKQDTKKDEKPDNEENSDGENKGSETDTGKNKDGEKEGNETDTGKNKDGEKEGNETDTGKNKDEENKNNETDTGINNGGEAIAGNTVGAGNLSTGVRQNVSLATTTSSSSDSEQESSEESAKSSSDVTAFILASSDTMVLSVNVDELDINSVSKGQQAEITVDAIEDKTFTGTVEKVGSSAENSNGGSAKYTVEVEIPGDGQMKEGMNASATITIEERENVVTIPVNALQERGPKVFVYTQADSEGNLTGEKEISTGLSDGDTVEITEGLSEGDTVYFRKTGNISEQGNFQKPGGMEEGFWEGSPQGDFQRGESDTGRPDKMPQGGEMRGNQQ